MCEQWLNSRHKGQEIKGLRDDSGSHLCKQMSLLFTVYLKKFPEFQTVAMLWSLLRLLRDLHYGNSYCKSEHLC